MPLQEALVLKVGGAIAKAILKTWLKDSEAASAIGTSAVDIISKLAIDFSSKRKLEREFHQVADRVAENLIPFFELEGARLDEGDKYAVALALAAGIDRTNLEIYLTLRQVSTSAPEILPQKSKSMRATRCAISLRTE